MKIPFFDLRKQYQREASELQKALKNIFKLGHFILGKNVQTLEEKIAQFTGSPYAVGVASGSDALWLALLALGVGPGDEVITTPYTFIATVTAILKVGAKPIFVDIESQGFSMDVTQLEKGVSKRTRAMIPVHLFGLCVSMDKVMDFARRHRLKVIEDAAQSLGATVGGKSSGSIADVGALSFYPTKNLGAAGDAGMILMRDEKLAQKVKMLRAHGSEKKYFHEILGWNSRTDEIQAAILLIKLKQLKKRVERRRKIANQYLDLLKDLPLVLPREPAGFYHAYNQFVIRSSGRDPLREFLSRKGIGTEIYYPLPLHLQPCFSMLKHRPGDFPNAEHAAQESLALPLYPEMDESQVREVARQIVSFFKGVTP
ncbi:MAG: DegT/DnrJ/EryC1/StrS family aminotransferase [Chlamydiae bacterium]|nr:DegT/DnrJ/EryC1/StrS family aminotransferase [Chlamydiota bacterium]MBI3266861.1 DegT/DnrJ/EryC1/StrS family aminotransferase [Chlamydiota bacterium]